MTDKERYQAFGPEEVHRANINKVLRLFGLKVAGTNGNERCTYPACNYGRCACWDGTPTAPKSERVPSNGG